MYKEVINQSLLIRPLHQAHFPISYEEEEEGYKGRRNLVTFPAKS